MVKVDNSAEIFGDPVSIADLAKFLFDDRKPEDLSIDEVEAELAAEYRFEIRGMAAVHGSHVRAAFKDGSALVVEAWR